ncbi:MAG TPA: ABC transporter substrate-binding protein [Casimicrobiaceae bacterium]|nr:ABC transporter substrate-binding protein [Casimicrobiaceae bacterium]
MSRHSADAGGSTLSRSTFTLAPAAPPTWPSRARRSIFRLTRRAFLCTAAGALLARPRAASALGKIARIGWLDAGPIPTAAPSRALTAFKQRLAELGYVEGRDFVIETRFADSYWERLPGQARDLVSRGVDVIVTIGTPTVMVAEKATTTIPIVMGGAGEPLELGLVTSLAHPGGNVTGVAHNPGPEFAGKSLELLKQAAPGISRVAVLWDSGALHEVPSLEGQRTAARALGLTLLIHDVTAAHSDAAFAAVLSQLEAEAPEAMFVYPNFIAAKHAGAILAFLSTHRLPSMFQDSWFVDNGALFSYYANWTTLRRRTADYVDKILKGARPGDLPVEQPTKFELDVNLKTATAFGLTIPRSILLSADKIVE